MGAVFLELEDHIGVEPDVLHATDSEGAPKAHPNKGEPGPLNSEAFSYAVPVMVTDPTTGKPELGSAVRSVVILPSEQTVSDKAVTDPDAPAVAVDARIIPGTRTIETINPQVVSILAGEGGGYRQVDAPKSSAQTRAKNAKDAGSGEEG